MNKLILIANVILAAAIPANKDESPIKYKPVDADNSSFVNAAGFKEAYLAKMELEKRKDIFARFIYVDLVKTSGHAVLLYNYDKLWRAYDVRIGSMVISDKEKVPTPNEVAKKLDKDYTNAQWYK